MITYRATLDVPAETAHSVSAWLLAHRRTHDTRPWQRAATPYVLRHRPNTTLASRREPANHTGSMAMPRSPWEGSALTYRNARLVVIENHLRLRMRGSSPALARMLQ